MGNCFPADAPARKTTVSGGKLESRVLKRNKAKQRKIKKGVGGWGKV